MDWTNVATQLQDKGFFTRYQSAGNDEWLDVCLPSDDVREDELIKALGGILVNINLIGPYHADDYRFARLTEKGT